jgi:hypothetical protein
MYGRRRLRVGEALRMTTAEGPAWVEPASLKTARTTHRGPPATDLTGDYARRLPAAGTCCSCCRAARLQPRNSLQISFPPRMHLAFSKPVDTSSKALFSPSASVVLRGCRGFCFARRPTSRDSPNDDPSSVPRKQPNAPPFEAEAIAGLRPNLPTQPISIPLRFDSRCSIPDARRRS